MLSINTVKQLKELAHNTQFVWTINGFQEPFLDKKETEINPNKIVNIKSNLPIKGFIATTKLPGNIKIRGTSEKVTLNLFVNGRLREKDLLRHIPTARIVENYTFGQIYAIYLYDDRFVITFNYKSQAKTVSFKEIESSPLTSKASPK